MINFTGFAMVYFIKNLVSLTALYLLIICFQSHAGGYFSTLHEGEQLSEIGKQLQQAIEHNDTKAVEKMIQEKALDINATIPGTLFSPLNSAIYHGALEVATTLLKLGADINQTSRAKGTPLMLAASLPNRLYMIRLLIAKEAELDARDQSQKTALQWALISNQKENAKELLIRGATLTSEDFKDLPEKGQRLVYEILQDPDLIEARSNVHRYLKQEGMYPVLNRLIMETMMGQQENLNTP